MISLKQTLDSINENPARLFLIDGIGALLSAFLLAVVLSGLESVFGIPSSTLYLLASFPVFFAIFDLYSYVKKSPNLQRFLRGIAVLNLLYCVFSHTNNYYFWLGLLDS